MKPFKCRRCGEAVAQTDGQSIYFGAKQVPFEPVRIKFVCPHCRSEVEWVRVRRIIPVA